MTRLWSCVVGPRLYKIYGQIPHHVESEVYVPNALEKIGNKIKQGLNILYNIGLCTSPLLALSFDRWAQHFTYVSAAKCGTGLGLLLIVALVFRGIGRRLNPTYMTFLNILTNAQQNKPIEKQMEPLRKYEFDFSAWPINFDWTEADPYERKPRVYVDGGLASRKGGIINQVVTMPHQLMAWILTILIGKKMVYPGSIRLMQVVVDHHLQQGREKLIREQGGLRHKVTTRDGNSIDTMLVDRQKKKQYPNGKTLVVCCEGNAGFYEVGLMSTPLEAGFSVLGWNHPGFAASTGSPYPSQEQNAVDAVIQFAIHGLGFREEDIIIYGWSIGGYSSTWAAMNYPQIRGLVLDATFDDILPLALPRMPACMGSIVTTAIRNYLNLNPGDQLCLYSGPVTIIRRTRDEIITTDETQLSCNRSNDLLMKLVRTRYPELLCIQSTEVLSQWLSEETTHQGAIMDKWGVDNDLCSTLLATYITEHGESYPFTIGEDMTDDDKTKLLLYLASKHLMDFNSGHNNTLDSSYFRKPWMPLTDSSYVQVD
ncbi:phosphatidylserine lipase ABHD16A-like [Homarus americanus]|uniref:Phosphatidylserine lipase ABHD16A-like n=1 Tax=Homarus americanus TaxID=6706 RepID=A0A8J5N595_HOMAM|nr:phosphatidylserine lipase ABHD16A-like [Homarus americanus]KAG7173269.1 Phosphatidylserine lipase ABHD16A-like [Homarus americanus]